MLLCPQLWANFRLLRLAKCLIAASTWKAATGCPEILQRQGPGLEVFPLLFEFGLAQEINSCNKNKRKESYRSCNLFQPHTSLVRHLLSFCELPPLFAGKFVHHFWIPAARLDIAHRGLVLHKVYSRYNKSAQNLSSLALPFLLMKAAMQPAPASKVSCTSSSSLIQKQHQTNSSQG